MDIWMSSNLGFRRFALRTEPSGLDGAKDMEPRSYLESKPPTSESEVPRMDHVPFFFCWVRNFKIWHEKKHGAAWVMPCQCANAVGGNLAPFKKHVDTGLLISIIFPLFYIHCFGFIVLHLLLYLCMMCMCIYLYFIQDENQVHIHILSIIPAFSGPARAGKASKSLRSTGCGVLEGSLENLCSYDPL